MLLGFQSKLRKAVRCFCFSLIIKLAACGSLSVFISLPRGKETNQRKRALACRPRNAGLPLRSLCFLGPVIRAVLARMT